MNILFKKNLFGNPNLENSGSPVRILMLGFFHTSTLIRRRHNAIDRLHTPHDGWLSDQTDIGGCFVSHFKNIFSTSNPAPSEELLALFHCSISDAKNVILCSVPSESEIHASLASLGVSKAPGPDGFTTLFYMKYWDCIKDTVLQAVWNFFKHNQLLKEQNHTFIALIPKKIGASTVHHYRPISLCNIIYKIISKLLANRLKPLLSNIISPFQTAFVPGRHIQDNSILAHEMFHTLKSKRGRGGLMAVNIDMEKDLIKWNGIFSWLFFRSLAFMKNGFTGFDSVLPHLHFQFCSTAVLLAYFPPLGVCSKVILSLPSSLLLGLKLFLVYSMVVFVVLKLLAHVLL
jgi:5-methylcytosine-specific restriction endonuclease McrA